ncbi:DUF7556 family protein [Halococcus saccharolyticus]|uniref:Uncharacterized protein n=1 Tax=Halococcus saccharolyticus DSM 5350 TaxID=1227455 RepID=M0ME89_9EURY|nr:hypothetical protein [Halococcus saccharolyticus]EMA42730.1 hypothetical protein C449_16348 [Halococcus saccharolyticus DSM 5350]
MTPDATAAAAPVVADDVMASVDDDGSVERFVIADISRDDAWVSMLLDEAASLPDWR